MFVYIVVYASKVLRQKNVTLEKTEQKKIYVMSVLNMKEWNFKYYGLGFDWVKTSKNGNPCVDCHKKTDTYGKNVWGNEV